MQTDLQAQIAAAEAEISEKIEALAKLRKQLPLEPVKDYTFRASNGGEVRLSDLFGDKNDLIIIHNMGRACIYCTLWADGFNGVSDHLEDRAGFALVSPDSPEEQAKFAASRRWKFKMLSGKGNSFAMDMGFDDETYGYQPGISTFVRDSAGNISRAARADLGPGDLYCLVWHLYNLLPSGRNNWEPKYRYERK
jgi:predicted dithiol-disulfide oxidoreductase (DUF899 family)